MVERRGPRLPHLEPGGPGLNDGLLNPVILPWGPVSAIVIGIVGGFIILHAWMAWQQGPNYVVPARDFIALLITVCFFAVVAYTFLGKLNEGGDILLGALIAAFSAVVALYFRQHDKEKEP